MQECTAYQMPIDDLRRLERRTTVWCHEMPRYLQLVLLGQVVGQAACGDPGVVLRSRAAAAGRMGGDLGPDAGDVVGVGSVGRAASQLVRFGASRAAPLAQRGLAGEFPEGDEGDAGLGADNLVQ